MMNNRIFADYYKLTDPDDIARNLECLDLILHNKQSNIEYKSDIETYSIMRYDYLLLKNTLKKSYRDNPDKTKLFRLFKDKEKKFFILASYHNLEGSPRENEPGLQKPQWDEWKNKENSPGSKERIQIEVKNGGAMIEILLLNTSLPTLFKNLAESLENYDYAFIETWLEEKLSNKIKSIFKLSIHFFKKLKKTESKSLVNDLKRYLQSFISYRSIFDIVGPSMVGPSSSHTAGANRIGQISREIIRSRLETKEIETIDKIKIKLIGSFRDTGVGHNTPEAIIGGLCGLPTNDENMIKKGMEALKDKKNFRLEMGDAKIKFGGFIKGSKKDDLLCKKEHNKNIAEIIAFTGKKKLIITGFSIGGGNVEIRLINRKKLEKIIDWKKGSHVPKEDYIPGFNTFEEMARAFGKRSNGADLIKKMIRVEQNISGMNDSEIYNGMKDFWNIMNKAIDKGLHNHRLSKFKLTGQNSRKLRRAIESNVMGSKHNIYSLALAYAVSVNEVNAKNGVIIACPTGGSCGILPSVLRAWKETDIKYNMNEKENRILDAMIVAGFFGMILFDDVPTAGADLGCQAEIGGGTAMTAAALVYLEGGTLIQMVNAFTLALKNCMGLVCDPVAGLVEIPCVKRNGIYSSVAISAAFYGLAGVKSFISADEVILAVKEVGERMDECYKETAGGGLAKTRDGKKVDYLFEQTTHAFF